MAYYRLYFFRCENRHIREVREFEAPHDFAAVYESAKSRSAEAVELWCDARKVTRWAAAGIRGQFDDAKVEVRRSRLPLPIPRTYRVYRGVRKYAEEILTLGRITL